MPTTYIVTIRGEFTETQAVVANGEEEAQEKAKQYLGETIDRKATGDLEVVSVKVMKGRDEP